MRCSLAVRHLLDSMPHPALPALPMHWIAWYFLPETCRKYAWRPQKYMAHALLFGPAGITDRAGAGDKLYSELHGELYQFSFASRRWFPLALRTRRSVGAPEARWPQGAPCSNVLQTAHARARYRFQLALRCCICHQTESPVPSACQVVGLLFSFHVTFLWSGG